jgi:hypothetical protein
MIHRFFLVISSVSSIAKGRFQRATDICDLADRTIDHIFPECDGALYGLYCLRNTTQLALTVAMALRTVVLTSFK